jgi:hypothetical protein
LLAELALLLRRELGRAHVLQVLAAGLLRPLHLQLVSAVHTHPELDLAAGAGLGIGDVHAMLTHAACVLERRLAEIGLGVACVRGRVAAAGGQRNRGGCDRQSQEAEAVCSHAAIQGAPAKRRLKTG